MQPIEFYYDFGSPNAYLVHEVLPEIAKQSGAAQVYRPMLLGGVFKATNNQSPVQAFAAVTHKLAYQRLEIARFTARHGIAFSFNRHFPVNTIAMMRAAIYAQGKPWEQTFIDAMFTAMWQAGLKMDDPQTLEQVLTAAGLPRGEILAAVQSPAVKADLIDATAAAVDRGVFGAPTMFVGTEMFFGKDALPDVQYQLAAKA